MRRLIPILVLLGLSANALTEADAARKYRMRALADPSMETIVNMVASWAIAYSSCKDKAASDKCADSEKLASSLKEMGWCYGETDQVSAGFRWHRC